MVQAISRIANKIAPKITLKYTQKLLMTPVRHNSKQPVPPYFNSETIESSLGNIHVISAGEGPVVLFTHGWSGSASQFYPLMEYIAQLGFKVVAFDHYGHGKSAGNQANLPKFIRALEAVLSSLPGPTKAIVSHSMATIAALNLGAHTTQHILIAPPFDFYTGFKSRILSTGISESLFTGVLASIEHKHKMEFKTLLPEQHVGNHEKISIIHDKEDKFAEHDLAYQQAQLHEHVTIVSTQGLGHGRILKSPQVFELVAKQLTKVI
ncbi:hypothetical protein PCIT_b0322 [Pseudoalteromonas citrea]|uniref:Serine aminopeptidase S33 domain-containing protein n=2 Tax=Pseudoalteromonas citrea TaxID=43655 RepID=A0AAD4AEE0_9GAMM|nr:hypothetical protein PCIT_b0322 [Pseudoalteromonas citrea]